MDMNIIIAGVGGQGILSIAYVLDNAAMKEGYHFKQAEVHGMSQRGGAVQSHLRFSKETIHSDIIAQGGADLILSVEPLEVLRYYHYLKPEGAVVSSTSPFVNIPDYPHVGDLYRKAAVFERHVLVDSEGLAKIAGSPKAQNMVVLGAAMHLFPFKRETCLEFVETMFKAKGEKLVNVNRDAFAYGERISGLFRAGLEWGMGADATRRLCFAADPKGEIDMESLDAWRKLFDKYPTILPNDGWGAKERIPITRAKAEEILAKGKV